MRKILTLLAVLILPVAAALAVPAYAALTEDCKPATVTSLSDRLDSGHHGDWAHLDMVRSVTICATGTTEGDAPVTTYLATFSDAGTLTTIAGPALSPRLGAALVGDRGGVVDGSAAQPFTAPGLPWVGYVGVNPSADTTTGAWVATIYGGAISTAGITEYAWTYTTCSEHWVDASSNEDGTEPSAGDITGAACPTMTPTPVVVVPTTTAASTPTETPTHTASSPASTTTGVATTVTTTSHAAGAVPIAGNDAALGGSLPVTGQLGPARLALIVGSILVLIATAVLLALALKRRRERLNDELASYSTASTSQTSTKYDTGAAPVPYDSPTLTWDRPTRYDAT